MKKLVLILIAILQSIFSQSQIALEHTYNATECSQHALQFKIQLDGAGSKYVAINMNTNIMTLYNLSHTVYKSFNIYTQSSGDLILFVSDHLFNTDNKIEYLVYGFGAYMQIFNEDGILIWQEEDCISGGGCNLMYHSADFAYPIVNTDTGTKLIVHIGNFTLGWNKVKVYSLPGTLTTGNMELYENQFQEAMKIYPNPSSSQSTIEFELPQGKQKGEIIIYDIVGNEIKRIPVTAEQKKLTVDNSLLPSGTYFYNLIADNYLSSKKVIVIR